MGQGRGGRAGPAPGPRRGRERSKGPPAPPATPATPSSLPPTPRPVEDPPYDVPGAGGRPAGRPQRPGRSVSLRERLLLTRPVWLQLRANAAAALHVLRTEPPGVSHGPESGLAGGGRRRRRLRGVGERERERPEAEVLSPGPLSLCRRFWCGNPTLAGAKPCACGCPKPVAPPLSPATTSRRALRVSWTGLGGRGWKQSGPGAGVFPREQPHFPSLRRLLGGLRAHVPRPGPAHLRLLPQPVSLAAGCLVSSGPGSLGQSVFPSPAGPVSPQSPEHPLTPGFLFPSLASGTSSSSRSSSPEPSARQPPTRNWKPSPIWALVRALQLPIAPMDKLRARNKVKARGHMA